MDYEDLIMATVLNMSNGIRPTEMYSNMWEHLEEKKASVADRIYALTSIGIVYSTEEMEKLMKGETVELKNSSGEVVELNALTNESTPPISEQLDALMDDEVIAPIDYLKSLVKHNDTLEYKAWFSKQGTWMGGLLDKHVPTRTPGIYKLVDNKKRFVVLMDLGRLGRIILGQHVAGSEAVRVVSSTELAPLLKAYGITDTNNKQVTTPCIYELIGGCDIETQRAVGVFGKVNALSSIFVNLVIDTESESAESTTELDTVHEIK